MTMTQAAAAVVSTTSGGSINAGIWTLVGIAITTIGVVVVAIIKQWGPWEQVASATRNADFARLREDIDRLTEAGAQTLERLSAAEESASKANAHAARSDVKLQTTLIACELLLALVEREMPDATEIRTVKRLLAQAASDDMGIGDAMRHLANIRGVGE